MSSVARLQKYSKELAKCSACGLCLKVCPTYAVTHAETDSPRGRVALMLALLKRRIEPEQTVTEFVHCTLCGKCQQVCSTGLALLPMLFAMRQMLHKLLPIATGWRVLGQALGWQPKVLDFLQSPLALAQKIVPPSKDALFQQLAVQPLGNYNFQLAKKTAKRVILFSGCLVRRYLPDFGQLCIAALEQSGHEVIILPELGCCGRPLGVAGAKLQKLVSASLTALSTQKFQYLLTPCPGCLATIRDIWPSLDTLSATERDIAQQLAAKTFDLTAYLAQNSTDNHKKAKLNGLSGFWWHKPCLMPDNAAKVIVDLLQRQTKLQQNALPNVCCGASVACFGQHERKPKATKNLRLELLQLTKSGPLPMADAMAKNIWQPALQAKAPAIVTACPGCKLALELAVRKARKKMPVFHALEIIYGKIKPATKSIN